MNMFATTMWVADGVRGVLRKSTRNGTMASVPRTQLADQSSRKGARSVLRQVPNSRAAALTAPRIASAMTPARGATGIMRRGHAPPGRLPDPDGPPTAAPAGAALPAPWTISRTRRSLADASPSALVPKASYFVTLECVMDLNIKEKHRLIGRPRQGLPDGAIPPAPGPRPRAAPAGRGGSGAAAASARC